MKRYTLVKDKEAPREEEIDRKKDFAAVKANYDKMTSPLYKKPLYKNPKAFLALLVILLIVWLIMLSDNEKKGGENSSTPKTEQLENK